MAQSPNNLQKIWEIRDWIRTCFTTPPPPLAVHVHSAQVGKGKGFEKDTHLPMNVQH